MKPDILSVLEMDQTAILVCVLSAACYIVFPFHTAHAQSVPPITAVQVDLDYVYDPDPAQQKKNLDLLTDRICSLGVDTVALQAFADPDGDDAADALYFPNEYLPLREDLFATAAKALKRCNVSVYAWIPLLAFIPPQNMEDLAVMATKSGKTCRVCENTYRLSPFHPNAIQMISGIYQDLAKTPILDGILFHDDGRLTDFEDGSPHALSAYKKAGFPASISCIRQNPETLQRWSRFKTRRLINFSQTLMTIIRKQHPNIRSARNLYALPVLDPESEQWFAQSLSFFLQTYDYIFLMAMVYMEEAENPVTWLSTLADTVLAETVNPAAIVFELQTINWRTKEKIPTIELIQQLTLLKRRGAASFAWYPDDVHQDHPQEEPLRKKLPTLH